MTLLCWRPCCPQPASQVATLASPLLPRSRLCLAPPPSCPNVAQPKISWPDIADPELCLPQSTWQLPQSPGSQLAGQADLGKVGCFKTTTFMIVHPKIYQDRRYVDVDMAHDARIKWIDRPRTSARLGKLTSAALVISSSKDFHTFAAFGNRGHPYIT